MHACQFGKVWLSNVDIERLALVDVCAPVCSHVDQCALRNLPHCLVQFLEVGGDLINVLVSEGVR